VSCDKLLSVSVDVDGIEQYRAIHGLSTVSCSDDLSAVHRYGVRRLADLADSERFPITWFVIGRELELPDFAAFCRERSEEGDELANHTLDHRYDLTRLGSSAIRSQVAESAARIEQCAGTACVGFRAPGYTLSEEVVEALVEQGYLYDSSLFPCPAYWLAKAAVMAKMRLTGRHSRAILDHPRTLFGPLGPHRLSSGRLLELPIQVTPHLRLPFIGTSLMLFGETVADSLTRSLLAQPFVNLELHGLDALSEDDGQRELRRLQPDLRLPVSQKLERLRTTLRRFREAGFVFVTLAEAARRFGAGAGARV